MNTNENFNLNQKQEDFKNGAIALNVILTLTALRALLLWDPFGLLDVVLVSVMAYFVHYKNSKNALFCACAYYLLDSILLLIDDPASIGVVSYFMRAGITYFLLRGALSKHQMINAKSSFSTI